ncbi:hypothetical protein LAZ67_15000823 [Cordylochernes scorpioides]|uniref:Mariner Mos1 transposase n=1 Tax=Cordylochernes scorpioides TaxID=51811 RepID=A0ABY6L9E3_9ARAC|nr:hypothetical protein LAZ67_15000823 [Cordylochernes scorpioides]
MESDPDSESGGSPTFPKKETTFGKTQEIVPGQEDVTPPPPVSDVRGRLTTTLHQLSAVTGHRERWNRYDGSYKAQSFFTNYDAQADRAQLQYSTRLKKPANLLQAPLRVINTRACVAFHHDCTGELTSRFVEHQVRIHFQYSKLFVPIRCLKQKYLHYERYVRGCIPNVDCGIRRSYLGPKQRLSVVQNVLRRPRRCERQRACRTPEHFNNRRKINKVEKIILANRRITVREVAEDLNISIGSCHSIFINDLGMRRVAAKFVPKLLNCDQKQHRMNIANEMLDSVRDDLNLLQRVITGDEAWVYGYDVETKAQSSQWKLPHEPRPKKARQVRSNVKVLLTVFFDCRGVVHHEFLPQCRTVNKEYYLQVMRNLREVIRQKRPDWWKNKNWLLHHDNAPAHTSLLVREFLAKNNTLMMPQPPYSPNLTSCDFFLFPKLKRLMKGRRYATLDEIKTASKEELKKIFKKLFF